MPSIDVIERKMNVNVDGKRNACSSVSDCRSAPSVVLIEPVDLAPICVSLNERMKYRASFSHASRSAPFASTPIVSTAATMRLPARASYGGEGGFTQRGGGGGVRRRREETFSAKRARGDTRR